ncbi:gliding motility protein GldM [Danxiaibacter flavus]|uniref:Gliding motility protein GldM n=1 Tax=Danxiaibacter flavus TaxID=3049108 RepID=A0ABV3ZKN9_9BACT|nr:gliding motility protein GldM [Chitinophagaceae bacterium DXS]
MALPKEPRQKMINLMYLVLTALLALNVSAEILNAFKTVNTSLKNSNDMIDVKNDELFKSFQAKMKDEKTRERATLWNGKAEQAKKLADDLSTYIEDLKTRLKKESGLEIIDGAEHYREDETNTPTRVMIEAREAQGKVLYDKLEAFKNQLLAIDPEVKTAFEKTLPIDLRVPETENKANRDWSSAYFRMTPTIAAVTILSKFQNDVKNSEAQVVDFCHRKVGEVEVIYDAFQAFAGTNSQYLMPGQELVVTAGVGAFSKKAQPTVTVDGAPVTLNADGVAEYKSAVGGPGTYTKKVKITFIKPDGTPAELIKDVQYTVGSPTGISVSADAVKVLYVGLTNPLSITGGAKGAESIQATIDQGSIVNKGGGKYDVTVTKAGSATINVTSEGKTTPFQFRVKTVPDPVAKVGQSKGGPMAVNEFKAQFGVRADLENFVFENVKFNISSFTLVLTGAGFPQLQYRQVNGDSFDAVRNLIENCRPGSTVTIDEIKATGPGGTRTLPPIVFNLR